ncbi:MAG: ABC transporter permease [Planctomycetaceae bacterium]
MNSTRNLGSARSFRWWHETVITVFLLIVLQLAGWLVPGFLKVQSQLLLSRQLWEFAILALGMTLIIISGGIDLSVGSAMGLCAVMFGVVNTATGSLLAASIASLITGLCCGAINGALVARLRLHPLIVTLATLAAYRGIAEGWSQGQSYSRFGDAFSSLSRGSWLGVPLPGFMFLVMAIGCAVFLVKTPTGRYLYAIGHNEQAAKFSGIPVNRIRFGLYSMSGLLAGFASLIYVARFDTAKADVGKGFELDVITAVVLGGTSIYGGRGNIPGTVLGLLLIHETRLFVSRYFGSDELRSIVIGCLLILSVLAYQLVSSRRPR